MVVWARCSIALAALGCGPGVDAGPKLVERCGSAEPIVLLELGELENVDLDDSVVPYEEQWLIGVQDFTHSEYGYPTAERLVAVDGCGGGPRVLVEGASRARPPQTSAEPWLACSETGRVFWFDPSGEVPPREVPAFSGCPERLASGALVGLVWGEEYRSDLVRVELGETGEPTFTVLAERTNSWDWIGSDTQHVVAVADTDEDSRGDLREVDVFSGTQTTVRNGVDDFVVSPDGRFIAWMVASDPPGYSGQWTLYERSTATEHSLGPSGRESDSVVFGDESAAAWSSGEGEGCCWPHDAKTELAALDALDALVLDGLVRELATLDGGQLLSKLTSRDWTTELRDVASGEIRTVAGVPDAVWVEDDSFRVLEGRGANPRRQTLLRLRRPSFTPEVLLIDVYDPVRIADRQWVSVREADAASCGDLVVVEEGQAESALLIDERVHAMLRPTSAAAVMPLVYAGCDDAGARTEVRVAELTVD